MHVTVEEVSPVEKKVAVEIEWPHVAAKLDEAYRELGRTVTLKGFRKGKVPRNMLESMFSRQVEQEVVQKLLQESFVSAAQQHELQPVAEPIVDDVELKKGTGFKYSARVEVRAQFEPKDYDGVELTRGKPQISDEELDAALQHKREELTEYKKIEGRDALAASDVVIADVKGEVAGKPITKDGIMVDLSRKEGGQIPGLGAALIGVPVASKDHEVALSAPGPDGKPVEAKIKVTVREAREKLMPELNDDFAKDTGEADTLEELKGKMREKLIAQKDKDVQEDLKKELVKELLKRNEFPVPSVLVDRQTEVLLQRARLGMAMRGVDYRTAGIDESKMKDDLRPAATDEVRAIFLIDAIGTKEKVEVSDADLEKRLAEMAKERGQNVPRLKAELQKEGRFDSVKHQLREEKTLDLLLTRANIKTNEEASSPSEK